MLKALADRWRKLPRRCTSVRQDLWGRAGKALDHHDALIAENLSARRQLPA
jgi:hypothetical protein